MRHEKYVHKYMLFLIHFHRSSGKFLLQKAKLNAMLRVDVEMSQNSGDNQQYTIYLIAIEPFRYL